MSELGIVILLFILLFAIPFAGQLITAKVLLIIILAALDLISLFVTVINIYQAVKWKRRFLNPI